jgi:hypothetical protein
MAVRSTPRAGRPLPPGRFLVLISVRGWAGRIRSIEKFNDLIGNRARDLPARSIVPQPTTLPRAPVWGSGCINPLVWDECTASRPGPFTPGERSPSTHWIGGWVGPGAGLDDVERRKILPLPGLELRPHGRPTRSQSLYRLRYPGSSHIENNSPNMPVYHS